MPKGNPSAQTIASEKYQKKAEQFEEACRAAGVSQAAQITKMMNEFIEEQKKNS